MDDEGWEQRMAQRAAARRESSPAGTSAPSIPYGTEGEPIPPDTCRQCWHDRYVWYGNAWGLQHREPGLTHCTHECHDNEIWLA